MSSRITAHRRRIPLLQGALLGVGCLLVYLPVLGGGFIWDDDLLITGNRFVQSLGGLPGIWRGVGSPDYLPLTSSLFWLEDRVWGLNPAGFHVTNVLLHAGAAILLWRVLLRLRTPLPWLAALLFAVHPVAVGTVAWIAEGKSTLAAVLALGALLEYLRWRDAPGRMRYAGALFLFLLALLSKSAVVMLPPVLLLCEWWRRGKVERADLVRTAPFFALSLIFGIVTFWLQAHRAIGEARIPMGGGFERFCAAGKALCFYSGKLLLPIRLDVMYPAWRAAGWLDALPGALVILVLAAAWRFRRTQWVRGFLFGSGVMVLVLLPVLGLVKLSYFVFSPVADHLQYMAIAPFAAMVAGGIAALGRWLGAARAVPVAGGVLAVALGSLSFAHASIYRDSASLWGYAVEEDPGVSGNQSGYALVLAGQGRMEEAIEHMRLAANLNPAFAKPMVNLAIFLDRVGRHDEALDEFRAAVALDPEIPEGHAGYALALVGQGRLDDAIDQMQTAVTEEPGSLKDLLDLALLLDRRGRLDDAEARFQQAIQLDPQAAQPHLALGKVMMEKRLPADAAREFQEAVRLDPGNADAHQDLGYLLAQSGQADAALDQYRDAARLSPGDVGKRTLLGSMLLQRGQLVEAGQEFSAALQLAPGSAAAHNNMGAVFLMTGAMDQARREFQAALQIDPTFDQARRNLAKATAGGQ